MTLVLLTMRKGLFLILAAIILLLMPTRIMLFMGKHRVIYFINILSGLAVAYWAVLQFMEQSRPWMLVIVFVEVVVDIIILFCVANLAKQQGATKEVLSTVNFVKGKHLILRYSLVLLLLGLVVGFFSHNSQH